MDKKRLRAPNFTANDNMLLCETVGRYRHIIENKKTDGANLQQKHAAWLEVVKEYNSTTSGCTRSLESLQQTYKNLKKKAKKKASDTKMDIPVDRATLVSNIEQYGTSSEGWKMVAENTGAPKEVCQKMFAALSNEADTKERFLKKNIMGTGGGPPPNQDNDPVLEKVKVLVGPVIDGMYTIYDGDSSIMASQNIPSIEAKTTLAEPLFSPKTDNGGQMTPNETKEYFTNDRANLKRKAHHLLTRKRKLELDTPVKQTVSEKFKKLANDKMELVELQQEIIKTQLEDEKEKLQHNRLLRAMEMEDMKKKYAHNEMIRKLELEKFHK